MVMAYITTVVPYLDLSIFNKLTLSSSSSDCQSLTLDDEELATNFRLKLVSLNNFFCLRKFNPYLLLHPGGKNAA